MSNRIEGSNPSLSTTLNKKGSDENQSLFCFWALSKSASHGILPANRL
ncbi:MULTISPECIES: hypothetical protein [Rahnella]|uniref:Uncharacterized protein n=1 Tax=Rahnella sp. (strain Y9602) TaxID=2703885 RepID=A0ABW6C8A0_RAHSY|nr:MULTISPECIES: hypothetical protein [Rahnella]MBU9841617.1 hypothetical protein [Rahnella aceris]MBU9860459.1 hypothetical protein [Rahnella aceris]MCM2445163.1 hypothetical protein [Rahnella sp. CG8]NIA87362.1 hypothetical protein [Rahnella aceris]